MQKSGKLGKFIMIHYVTAQKTNGDTRGEESTSRCRLSTEALLQEQGNIKDRIKSKKEQRGGEKAKRDLYQQKPRVYQP